MGLGEEYFAFCTSINTPSDPIIVDSLLDMLLPEETKIDSLKTTLVAANVAKFQPQQHTTGSSSINSTDFSITVGNHNKRIEADFSLIALFSSTATESIEHW